MNHLIYDSNRNDLVDARIDALEGRLVQQTGGGAKIEYPDYRIGFDLNNKRFYFYDKKADRYYLAFSDITYNENLSNEKWFSDNFTALGTESPWCARCGLSAGMYLPIKAKKAYKNGDTMFTLPDKYQPICAMKFEGYISMSPSFSIRVNSSQGTAVAVGDIAVGSWAYLYAHYNLKYPAGTHE